MSVSALAIDVLLALGVAAELVCCLGLLAMRNALDRLHYAGAGSTVGAVLIGAALIVQESLSGSGVKTLLVVAFMVVAGAVVTSATARMARLREQGQLESLPEEQP